MASGSPLHVERLPGRPGEGIESTLSLRLSSDLSLVDQAIELLIHHCFVEAAADNNALFRLRVAVAEAITNAIECGNACDPRKTVAVRADLLADRIRVAVSDEGPGFDPSLVPDPRAPEVLDSPCGRGLFLIRNLADQVEFNERGNTIWMTLPRS